MEVYEGVKFPFKYTAAEFSFDHRLKELNHWAWIFSQLGLAPVHPGGAYGNQSYRSSGCSFIITRSGMVPEKALQPEHYCLVEAYEETSASFLVRGCSPPSSESYLHHRLYQFLPGINTILHGHNSLFNSYASQLDIPQTNSFKPYGTVELAESALEIIDFGTRLFILRDHGFIALGEDIESTGKLVLDYYGRLINLLR